jgi:hypothetical protein
MASLAATKGRREQRRQLRRLGRDRRQHESQLDGQYTIVLAQWFGCHDP